MVYNYNIHGLLNLSVVKGTPGRRLEKFLRDYLCPAGSDKSITVSFTRDFTDTDSQSGWEVVKNSYKGIAWKAGIRRVNGEITDMKFWSAGFRSFLFLRLVIIPLLEIRLGQTGGFYSLGTVLEKDGQVYFMFGGFGAGKSRTALKLLEKGFRLIADGSLAILADGSIKPILNEVEFRYATVRDSRIWNTLSFSQKMHLHACRLISLVTARKISFNLSIEPEKHGISCCKNSGKAPVTAVWLDPQAEGVADITPVEFSRQVAGYITDYHRIFGNVFTNDFERLASSLKTNIENYFGGCVRIIHCPPAHMNGSVMGIFKTILGK